MKILVVENDNGFREAWVHLLRDFGNDCVSLPSLETQLARDVHKIGYDLALVDRRARDDFDKFDTSGQDLATELCSLGTPAVLVTGFRPDDRDVFNLLWTGALTGIADKDIDMLELAQCVEEFNVSHRFPNCVAKFRWKGETEEAFGTEDWERVRAGVANADATPEDFATLFRSLIPPFAHNVELHPISPGHGGAALFHARVSSGDGPVVEEVAIKYGERAAIRSEAMRYDRHVGPLPDGVAAHLRWRKETKTLGALAYSWVGDSIEDGIPFGPICDRLEALTWRRRRSAVERLFSVSLNPWYEVYRSETGRPVDPITLLKYYTGQDGYCAKIPFLEESLPSDLPSPVLRDGPYWDFGPFGKRTNPAVWLARGNGSKIPLMRYGPCHGDLHVKNIFVLPDDSPRLIDFGETALGHVFRDFAALETSIRLTCCNIGDLGALKRAADCASAVSGLGEHINYRSIPDDQRHQDLRETLKATMQVRRAALDAAGDHAATDNMKEYLFALAVHMLRYATGVADEASSKESAEERMTRIWHALYAAACATTQAERLV